MVTDGQGQVTLTAGGESVYFGGKLIRSQGVTVATDRLGSVRANANGEKMAYLPYGQERGTPTTPENQEKFATYWRDQNLGANYADQRYYGYGSTSPFYSTPGRFLSPDPGGISTANPKNPMSWNRYAYANSDPINFNDPSGQIVVYVGTTCSGVYDSGNDMQYVGMDCEPVYTNVGTGGPTSDGGGGGGGGGSDVPPATPVNDATMLNEWMQGLRKASQILNSNPDCADLFGGGGPYPDPGTMLAQISNSFQFAPISSPANTVTSATTSGNGPVGYGSGTVFTSVTIVVNNTTQGASFVSGSLNDWTTTILHELGHAIYDLYGTPADQIVPDSGNTAQSEANTALIKQKCKL